MKKHLVLGPPGTGKTTFLLGVVEQALADGIAPEEIAFVAFTRKAAYEASSRAVENFGIEAKRFIYFRTLHSLAYRMLNLTENDVMRYEDYKEVGNEANVEFTEFLAVEDAMEASTRKEGDVFRALYGLAYAKMESLEEGWRGGRGDVDPIQYRRFVGVLETYKKRTGVLDFSDMLAVARTETESLPVKVLIIDEAQDLSLLQWAFIDHVFSKVDDMYIAGDDDQAIYRWSGAAVGKFMHLEPDTTFLLDQSWRVPRAVASVAAGLTSRIKQRFDKKWQPRDEEGFVERVTDIANVPISTEHTWYLLARNGYLLSQWEKILQDNGIPYERKGKPYVNPTDLQAIRAWERLQHKGNSIDGRLVRLLHDRVRGAERPKGKRVFSDTMYALPELQQVYGFPAWRPWWEAMRGRMSAKKIEFYLTALRRGVDLDAPSKITVSTIHGVKGGEAEMVGILSDVSPRTAKGAIDAPDDEARTFYVGVTRSRHGLYIVEPRSANKYEVM